MGKLVTRSTLKVMRIMTGWQLPHLVLAFDWYLLTLMEKVIFLFKKVSQKLRLSPQYLEKINQRLFYNIEKS